MQVFTPVVEPPFCPNQECVHHRNPEGWPRRRAGTHARKHPPHVVQRFQCLACGRSFSTQTFRLGYWCRRQDLFGPVYMALMSCSGLRQIGRQLGLTRGIVTVRTERLGRHCLLLHQQLRPRQLPDEPVVLDGFETFEHSQFSPMHVNLLVGAISLWVHGFTESELRRKGRMTPWQKRRREQLEKARGRPDPKAVERGVRDVLETFVPEKTPVVVASDDHPAYPRAIRALSTHQVQHHVTLRRRAARRATPCTRST
jgi:transposase-like protein